MVTHSIVHQTYFIQNFVATRRSSSARARTGSYRCSSSADGVRRGMLHYKL